MRRRGLFGSHPLVAEETPLTAAQIGKENGDDDGRHR